MCGGGSESTSAGAASAAANVSFNPSIVLGSTAGTPGEDTGSTFAAKLLSAPAVSITIPEPIDAAPGEDKTIKLLTYIAVALAVKRVLRG